MKEAGYNIQPWHTPFPIWNQSVVPYTIVAVVSLPAYRFLKSQVRWSGIFISSDHELLIDKFRLRLKKVGTTIRPFTYDLNQIPYNYTVEVTNSFKGLDLIDRVPEELWLEVHEIVQEAVIKTIPKKKKCKKAKWLSE